MVSDAPLVGNALEIITSNPFTLISAWSCSFSLYRTLNNAYEKLALRARTGAISQLVERSVKLGSGYMKNKLFHITAKLKIMHAKLSQLYTRAESKSQDLFKRSVEARLKNEQDAATIFMNECAEARKIASVLLTAQLALETVIMRLETMEQRGAVAEVVLPMARVLHETRRRLGLISPEISEELDKVDGELVGIMGGLEMPVAHGSVFIGQKSESQKILYKAELLANHRLAMSFPDFNPGSLKPLS